MGENIKKGHFHLISKLFYPKFLIITVIPNNQIIKIRDLKSIVNSTGRESRNSSFHSSTSTITNMRSMRNHVTESSEIHAESLSHNILAHMDSAEISERAATRNGISATPPGRAEDQTES